MSFFYNTDTSFTPLFRLLDDFDTYQRQSTGEQPQHRRHGQRGSIMRVNPKFDVIETETAYELHGELGGLQRENVKIEFSDDRTIVIHGHVERSYAAGTPPAGQVEDTKTFGAIEEASPSTHKATVEDEDAGASATTKGPAASSEVTKKPAKQERADKLKYFLSERSVGEFNRTFTFPAPVDHDAISASLKDGILSVTVPKAKKRESRRVININ
jgi:HSP20 family molecular chaperone IbpA